MSGGSATAPIGGACAAAERMAPATVAWLLALVGWTAFITFYAQGAGAGFEPIDAWVAQTAREMLDHDQWLVPQFAGETRLQKSPGPYWAVMAASLVAGRPIDATIARVPSALAAIGIVLTVFLLARQIAGDRAAVFAGFAAASSPFILWWSHRAASDLGLAMWTTISVAALWAACEPRPSSTPSAPANRGPHGGLLLLGYFAAGMGMLWKLPMPLVMVGLPAVLYVVLWNRWRMLGSWWHVAGLIAFLLPWLPWAIAVMAHEPNALAKWRVETLDRFTGDLPNIADQNKWFYWLTYLGPMIWYTLPYSLSLPAAFSWAFRRRAGLDPRGSRFVLVWIVALFAFLTASAGKEERYFLPALPPLFVLLGIELAAFFDPARARPRALLWLGALATWIVLPAGLIGGGLYGLRQWWVLRGQFELGGVCDWSDVWRAALVTFALLAIGFALCAGLCLKRRPNAAFGALVATMFAAWLWTWPKVVPLLMSQRPFIEFAERLADPHVISPSRRLALQNVGTHEPRVIWYSDVRFPRVLDQLKLLEEQRGKRSLDYEKRRYGEAIVERLQSDQPVLFVAALTDFATFLTEAPHELEAAGRPLPPLHLWIQSRCGTLDRQMVVFGNQRPPFAEPALELPESVRDKAWVRAMRRPPWDVAAPATAPATGTP